MFAMQRDVAEQLVADRRAGREAVAQRRRLRRLIARAPEHEMPAAVSVSLVAPARPLSAPARTAAPSRGSKVA
jgi:hypothetical protein